jgi:hypothetical protein
VAFVTSRKLNGRISLGAKGSLMYAFKERLTQACLPLASIECFRIVKPETAETVTVSTFAMYFFTTASLAASDGSNLREMVFCIKSGFYPEKY